MTPPPRTNHTAIARLVFLLCATLLCQNNSGAEAQSPPAIGFSDPPADAELSAARVFDEPLVSLSGPSTAAENRALAKALAAYSHRAIADDCSSLAEFAENFPQSRWTPSLLLHLGVEYYNYGYFSKALDAWQRSWALFQTDDYPPAKAQADRALGELARMYGRIGRAGDLSALLDSAKNRDVGGPGHQMVHAATMALWTMENRPDFSFGCGPSALDRILQHFAPAKAGSSILLECKSGTNGFALDQVAEISVKLGMNYQMAYRPAGAPLVLPSVIHWKLGHYAAVIERRNHLILIQDYTFRSSLWVSQKVLDEEASGYFLVPPGDLPKGWRPVSATEGHTIWGKGPTETEDGDGTTRCHDKSAGGSACPPCNNGCKGNSAGMTTYSMHALLTSLSLEDTPMKFSSPFGPQVDFTATYNQLEANQPASFYFSNLGPKWDCNWVSFVADDPVNPGANVYIYLDGGGTLRFNNFDPVSQTYSIEPMTQSLLVQLTSSSYELRYPDGSRREYAQSDGATGSTRRVFLTTIFDAAGNAITINYDAQLHITNVVNALGQATTFAYTNTAYPFAITSVTDPFGRSASLLYNADGTLAQITDTLGLVSQYTYGPNQFVAALTTPYGTTTFTTAITNGSSYLTATDPLGGTEAMEYSQSLPVPTSLPALAVPHGLSTFNLYLDARDSFYWDKKAFAAGGWDWSNARIYHWLHQTGNGEQSSRILESEKAPLESRIWYNYPGQSTNFGAPYYLDAAYTGASDEPTIAARVLDDGTTQLSTYGYNSMGNVTNVIDPVGRTFTYDYDTNHIDLLDVRMTHNGKNELLTSATYNPEHMPLTITDAAGQTTAITYGPRGQILTMTDPLNHTTTFTYDDNGFLISVQGPLGGTNDAATIAYDAFNRIQAFTDTEGYTVTSSYDAFDRPVSKTYPDGTSEQFVYDRLDLVAMRDRLGRWTTNTYNANRQLVSTLDSLGRLTRFEWCNCGSLEAIIDPMGRETSWTYDLQDRPIGKKYPDGSMETYTYETSSGRLHAKTDANGQETIYDYYADNTVKSVSYVGGTNATPTVNFTYDPDYDRILTMQDGMGTTLFSYIPITPTPGLGANQLQSISGPLPNSTIVYQYDSLGRVVSRAINGVTQSAAYDVLGRTTSLTNVLGSFQYSYVNSTARLAAESYPNGQATQYSYYGNTGDHRLQQILNLKADSSLLSSFSYGYNAVGEIAQWSSQWDTLPSRMWFASYDAMNELTNVISTGGPLAVTNYTYAYDPAENRTLSTTNTVQEQFQFNSLNQLIGESIAPANAPTYEWDAADRLVAINSGAHRTEFSYDGLDRRTRIVEEENGAVTANNTFLWCDNELCEERDGTGTNVVRRLFPQGEVLVGGGTTNLFYTRDHLGSIREAVDASGMIQARYDYDPYGQQTVLDENIGTTFGYTGHFEHKPSGLYLTKYRGLDPSVGRWLNRDPIGEEGGLNLYAYVDNDPIGNLDPFGLCGQEKPHVNEVLKKAFHNAASLNEGLRVASLANQLRPSLMAQMEAKTFQEVVQQAKPPNVNSVGGALSAAGAAWSTGNNVYSDVQSGAGAVNTVIDGGSTLASSLLTSANPVASMANVVTAGGASALVNNGINGVLIGGKTLVSSRVTSQEQEAIKKIMTRNWATVALWKAGEAIADWWYPDDPCN